MVCRRSWIPAYWLLLGLFFQACTSIRVPPPAPRPPATPFHLAELAESGDPERRASLRLLLDGLDFDSQGRRAQARSQYQLALQLDPGNPYAYLAFARHYAESSEPERALAYLDKLDSLLSLESEPQGVEAHQLGVRGVALRATGQQQAGIALLSRAKELAPEPWQDGHLSAAELR